MNKKSVHYLETIVWLSEQNSIKGDSLIPLLSCCIEGYLMTRKNNDLTLGEYIAFQKLLRSGNVKIKVLCYMAVSGCTEQEALNAIGGVNGGTNGGVNEVTK
jgi:hypothetical protein